jgi:hypothetical protein
MDAKSDKPPKKLLKAYNGGNPLSIMDNNGMFTT